MGGCEYPTGDSGRFHVEAKKLQAQDYQAAARWRHSLGCLGRWDLHSRELRKPPTARPWSETGAFSFGVAASD